MAVFFGPDKKWTKSQLKYCFTNTLGSSTITESDVESAFQNACAQWAAPTGLTFAKTTDVNEADIKIKFAPVDGRDGRLAQTSPPDGANTPVWLTFDTAEEWTKAGVVFTARNFLGIALHELGHILGLGHSANPTAVMYRNEGDPRIELTADDKDGAEFLYSGLEKDIAIVNETGLRVSWFAFNDYDALKLIALNSGNLAPSERVVYQPVANDSGKYFIRFTHQGGGTELGGATSTKRNMVVLMPAGEVGFEVTVS